MVDPKGNLRHVGHLALFLAEKCKKARRKANEERETIWGVRRDFMGLFQILFFAQLGAVSWLVFTKYYDQILEDQEPAVGLISVFAAITAGAVVVSLIEVGVVMGLAMYLGGILDRREERKREQEIVDRRQREVEEISAIQEEPEPEEQKSEKPEFIKRRVRFPKNINGYQDG